MILAACGKQATQPGTVVASNSSSGDNGGWVSSGGELFQANHNPWFLKDAGRVTYCVRRAEAGFSADEAAFETALRESLEFWRSDLSLENAVFAELMREDEEGRHLVFGPDGYDADLSFVTAARPERYLALPGSSWTKTECTATTDVEFVLGYEALTARQKAYLETPQNYIAAAVRTAYDGKRGRGFVLIGSDRGERTKVFEGRWSGAEGPKYLAHALIHELGHVFGVPHLPGGPMREAFLDRIATTRAGWPLCRLPNAVVSFPARRMRACGLADMDVTLALEPRDAQGVVRARIHATVPAQNDRDIYDGVVTLEGSGDWQEVLGDLPPAIRLFEPDANGISRARYETRFFLKANTTGTLVGRALDDQAAPFLGPLVTAPEGVKVVLQVADGRLTIVLLDEKSSTFLPTFYWE